MSQPKKKKVHQNPERHALPWCGLNLLVLCLFLLGPIESRAEEPLPTPSDAASTMPTATASPTPRQRKPIRLAFVPPPLEGTISLGIYSHTGTLVRVLHREEPIDNFEAGDDALRTTWDGKSDAGEELPAGRYHARGFLVGHEIKAQFVASHFGNPTPLSSEGATSLRPEPAPSPGVADAPAPASTLSGEATEPQLAPTPNEAPGKAPPVTPAPGPPPPAPRSGFTVENGVPLPHPSSGVRPPEEITVRLMENPLQNDRRAGVRLAAGFNAQGSFLRTSDGLPLRTINDEPAITTVILWPVDSKTIDVFQDNGSKVDQLRVPRLNRIMAFDCGDFELK